MRVRAPAAMSCVAMDGRTKLCVVPVSISAHASVKAQPAARRIHASAVVSPAAVFTIFAAAAAAAAAVTAAAAALAARLSAAETTGA